MLEWLNMFSIEYIIKCESIHFLFSACLGYLVYWLTSTILSKRVDPYTFPLSFLLGVCISITVHILIDFFTAWA